MAIRRTRLRALRGLTNEQADQMIASQMASDRKRARSHYVIDNAGSREDLEHAARRVWEELQHRA
jgi:dephospho-CoA kinase